MPNECDQETKIQIHKAVNDTPGSPRPRIKSMFIVLFDTKGIVHKDLLSGQTVNDAFKSEVPPKTEGTGLRVSVQRTVTYIHRRVNSLISEEPHPGLFPTKSVLAQNESQSLTECVTPYHGGSSSWSHPFRRFDGPSVVPEPCDVTCPSMFR